MQLLGIAMLLTGCSHLAEDASTTSVSDSVADQNKSTAYQTDAQQQAHIHQRHMLQLQQQADAWRGVPYRYGGQNKSGIDCSSFIQTTYASLWQHPLPRSTQDQVKQGHKIDVKDARAGDLLFFKTGFKQRHAGIYMGNGLFVHASTSKGVIVSSLDNPYWQDNFWQSRRIDAISHEVSQDQPYSVEPTIAAVTAEAAPTIATAPSVSADVSPSSADKSPDNNTVTAPTTKPSDNDEAEALDILEQAITQ